MGTLTIAQTLDAIRKLGFQASYRTEYKEFRVTLRGLDKEHAEASAYYTNDKQDAIDTAVWMAKDMH